MEDFGAGAEEKDRNFVTALARGLDLLRCFRRNEITLTNSDFSERTGLPKATISRLTHTLVALDYLVADARVGTYRLSAGVLQLGYGVLSAMDVVDRAEVEMSALRDGPNTYVTVALGEQHRLDVVYLMTKRSFENVSLSIRVGARLPVFRSAIGRSILVGMQDEDRERVFRYAREAGPDALEDAEKNYAEAAAEYADKGFVSAYGTWRNDVNGIAVPIRTLNGARVYGLNVGGPSFHVKKKQLETVYADLLLKSADALTVKY